MRPAVVISGMVIERFGLLFVWTTGALKKARQQTGRKGQHPEKKEPNAIRREARYIRKSRVGE